MATSSEEKRKELLKIIAAVDDSAPPSVRQEIFNFIRRWWNEVGEDLGIKDVVCDKLKIGPAQFNMLLMNPGLSFGMETLHKSIKPGWLKDYLDYTSGHEAPEDFHVWVGLTVIGAAIRRRAWINNVYYNMYPNLYTILVSPPGIGKKTTAINIGTSILREAVPECRIISEKCTPEALAKRLAKALDILKESGGMKIESRAEGLILAPELTVFLGPEQYNSSLIMFLTRLYDCSDILETETIARGIEKLKNVCVSLLGATTPSEIDKAIPSSARGSGFLSRLNIIQKDTTSRVVPFAVPVDPAMRELLVVTLRRIHTECEGKFDMSKEGIKWFEDYYRRHSILKNSGAHNNLSIERQPDHLMKVAMILSASEHGGMKITDDHFQRAFNILEIAMRNCGDVLKMIDTSEKGKMTQITLNAIAAAGGLIDRTTLCKRLYRKMNKYELNMVVETLEEAGMISSFLNEKTRYYKLVKLEES